MPDQPDRDQPSQTARRNELLAVAAKLFATRGYAQTSMRDVAEEAGMLAGSLYHYFPAKEALAETLVRNFHRDLTNTATGSGVDQMDDPVASLEALARKTARTGEQHMAALQLCLYAAPSSFSATLHGLLHSNPPEVERQWRHLVAQAAGRGVLRSTVDLASLRTVLRRCSLELSLQSHPPVNCEIGVDRLTRITLRGLATEGVAPEAFSESASSAKVAAVVKEWHRGVQLSGTDRRSVILAAARSEFARRGFGGTTMRNVADSAALNMSSMYRHFESKDLILTEIIRIYSRHAVEAFRAVAAVDEPSPLHRLDALLLLMVHIGRVFHHELSIMAGWWQITASAAWDTSVKENRERLSILQHALTQAATAGQIVDLPDTNLTAVCVRSIAWTPQYAKSRVSVDRTHAFVREIIMNGAVTDAGV